MKKLFFETLPSFFKQYVFLLLIVVTASSVDTLGQVESMQLSPIYSIPGAIILNTGDTVYGELKCKKYVERNFISQIMFTDSNGEKTRYDACSIQGFGIGDTYCSRPSPKKGIMVFMKRLEEGKITVFQNSNSTKISTGGRYKTETGDIDGISIELHQLLLQLNLIFSGYFLSYKDSRNN